MLVIVEKPLIARALHLQLSNQFPGEQIRYLLANQFGWPFVFDYPSHLSWHDYPCWLDARYRLGGNQWQMTRATEQWVREPVHYAALDAQPVLVVADAGRSSLLATEHLLRHLQEQGKVTTFRGYHVLNSLAESDIDKSVREPVDATVVHAACVAAQLKADFEFSFLVNAAGLLTRAYHAAGGIESHPVFSKYTVLTLYALRNAGPTLEGELIGAMSRWKGTGRYTEVRATLGSAASRAELVESLKHLGLASSAPTANDTDKTVLSISALGEAFLAKLHPDCEDPDLPFRIEQWLSSPDTGRAAAQRYIRTWFGKQKRYMTRWP